MHGFISKFSLKNSLNTNMIYFATDSSIKKIFSIENVTDTPKEEAANLTCDEGSRYIFMTYPSPVLHH